MNNNQEIFELRHKRRLIRQKLKTRADNGDKNNEAHDLLIQYLDYTDQLSKLGFNQPHSAYYLNPDYWKSIKKDNLININSKPIVQKPILKIYKAPEIKINIKQEPSYYIFNLSWTIIDNPNQDKVLNYIQKYLQYLGLTKLEEINNINSFYKEKTITYEKQCNEEEYKLIIKGTQFNIDNLTEDEIIGRNIAIYGKKKEIN